MEKLREEPLQPGADAPRGDGGAAARGAVPEGNGGGVVCGVVQGRWTHLQSIVNHAPPT